jgi:hypothetical protein
LIGPFLVKALPVQPLRFPAGLFGFSLSPSPPGLKPAALLSAAYFTPRSLPSVRQPHPPALGECTSPGVPSPTALDSFGCPYDPGDPNLPAPSVLRVSHPLDVLLHPKPCGLPLGSRPPIFRPTTHARPLRSWGSTGPPTLAWDLSITGRATAPGFPLQGSLLPHDEPVLAGSPLSRFQASRGDSLFKGAHGCFGAPQSLDRRRVGVSQRSYLRAPAFVRFLADLHARS